MRKKTIKTTCKRLEDQTEMYIIKFEANDNIIEEKADKENLRHLIEIIDNTII
jgi:hypothetical protein